MKCIIFAVILASLFSLNNAQGDRDASIERVCSGTKFKGECINTVSLHTSGAADSYSALRAGLNYVHDMSEKALLYILKMNNPDKTVADRFQTLRDSSNKAMQALNAHDYMTVSKELGAGHAAVQNCDSKQEEYLLLTELCKLLNKVATNNLQILLEAVA